MPYSLVRSENGKKTEIKPLVNDNPKSKYGLEDRRIESRAKKWASELNNMPSLKLRGVVYTVEHYVEGVRFAK